jgi:acetyl-CoA carboxylase carboxyltransferase component
MKQLHYNKLNKLKYTTGICEVKYRAQEQVVTMHRLDSQLQDLDEALLHNDSLRDEERSKVSADIKAREKTLSPLYTQIAHEFADLHDRAGIIEQYYDVVFDSMILNSIITLYLIE